MWINTSLRFISVAVNMTAPHLTPHTATAQTFPHFATSSQNLPLVSSLCHKWNIYQEVAHILDEFTWPSMGFEMGSEELQKGSLEEVYT